MKSLFIAVAAAAALAFWSQSGRADLGASPQWVEVASMLVHHVR